MKLRAVAVLPACSLAGVVVAGLLILSAAGCGQKSKLAGKTTAKPVPAVVVAPVLQQTIPIYADYVAETEASSTVTVRARVEGLLVGMHFQEGRRVSRGQLLYKVDPSTYEANVSSAKAQLAKAEAELEWWKDQVRVRVSKAGVAEAEARLVKAEQDVARVEPLVAAKAIPAKELDAATAAVSVAESQVESARAMLANQMLTDKTSLQQAKAAVQAARASLVKAELDLSYTQIKSPVSGIVGRTQFAVGNLVGRPDSSVLNTISAVDPIYVNFSISEKDYLKLAEARGSRRGIGAFRLVLADNSEFPYAGKFGALERALDVETGTLTVRAVFPNPEGELRPGQFCRVRVALGERTAAVLVPQRAVQDMQGSKTVLLMQKNNKPVFRTVEISDRFGTDYVISSGVEPGDVIIVEGIQKVAPGMSVKPTNKPARVQELRS